MDVVVKGRHCSVTDRFRRHVEDKLVRLERFAAKAIRLEVEVSKERNPRLADRSERVEITFLSKGPAVRAEAAADDRFSALDLALDKLLARLRKAHDRRRVHHGARTPISVAQATAGLDVMSNGSSGQAYQDPESVERPVERPARGRAARSGDGQAAGSAAGSRAGSAAGSAAGSGDGEVEVSSVAGIEVVGDGPLVVREKTHNANPITLDQALYEMELIGHDFYLFIDADTKLPSVVYRRRGYDYGVIRLESTLL